MERQSNIELLRIIATIFILVLHTDFFSIGSPSMEELHAEPVWTLVRLAVQYATLVGVDVFVLISGWFGMRLRLSSVAKLIFQCAFFGYLVMAVCYAAGLIQLSGVLLVMEALGARHWFVVCYIGLMILAPALNSFVETAPRRQLTVALIAFFAFQTLYGNLVPRQSAMQMGYSTMSFIGLYLIARYIKVYKSDICNWNGWKYTYLASVVATVALAVSLLPTGFDYMLSYISPLNILAALSLLLAFAGMRIGPNRFINWVAAGSFGAYLLHTSQIELYHDLFSGLYATHTHAEYCGYVVVLVSIFFTVGVCLDASRRYLWSKFCMLLSCISNFGSKTSPYSNDSECV